MYTLPHTNTRSISDLDVEKITKDLTVSSTIILDRSMSPTELTQIRSDVHTYCQYYEMSTEDIDPYHIRATGTHTQHASAFKIDMVNVKTDKGIHQESTQPISIPAAWKDKVQNILGYDTKQIAMPYVMKGINFATDGIALPDDVIQSGGVAPQSGGTTSRDGITSRADIGSYFYPTTLARLYNFPTNLDGTNQKIGIIELGGGYVFSDFTTYFAQLGISGTPNVTAVSVDGGTNNPSDTSGANVEVVLDVEVIAAIVPRAAIMVYFAPNSYQGFYNAINAAINANCSIVSISWGAPEPSWSQSMLTTYNNLFQSASTRNVSIFAAAGDRGSSDGLSGVNVDFPASSPYVCACGGTRLTSSNNTSISTEVVWNNNPTTSATGGGISSFFSKPSYQSSVTYSLGTRRGVPDVAGVADPSTGYILYSLSEGGWFAVGGTSAVSPLWSALVGRINQSLNRAIGFVQPTLYANPLVFRDITQGNNGAYTARVGWDPCTGNGTPNGQSILTIFANASTGSPVANFSGTPTSGILPLTVNFTDQSTNNPTSWLWNFGNSTTSTLRNPSNVYSTAGTYNVSLTATNTNGSNTFTRNSYITVSTNTVSASFVGTPTSGNVPLTVNFTDQSTGAITSWSWNFGDSTSSTTRNPSKTYNTGGIYTVSLTASNGITSNSLTRTNYINVLTPTLAAAFTGTPTSGNAPLAVTFTNQSTGNPTPNSWLWSFGDNTSSISRNPSHTYVNPGTYTVSLTANNGSTSNTLTRTNYITAAAVPTNANFTSNVTTGRVPLRVSFVDLTPGSTQWRWNFGDGGSSTLKNPIRIYSRVGTYTVTLIVTTPSGTTTISKAAYIRTTR